MHPYWGCSKLEAGVHQAMMAGLQNRPSGTVIRVRCAQLPLGMLRTTLPPIQVPYRPSHDTVRRVLKSFGFVSRRAVKRPLLTMRHKAIRREFAAKFLRWTPEAWKNIIFSDEKIFRVRPGGLVRHWKATTVGKYSPQYVLPQVQRAEGLMVWAAMNGRGDIVLRRFRPRSKPLTIKASWTRPYHSSTHGTCTVGNCPLTFSFPTQSHPVPLSARWGKCAPC